MTLEVAGSDILKVYRALPKQSISLHRVSLSRFRLLRLVQIRALQTKLTHQLSLGVVSQVI